MTHIRYARGQSSLGDFRAAFSDRGLVAFEFVRPGVDDVGALRGRFPEATIEDDAAGLSATAATLARVIDEPARDPGLPLDLIGTDYEKQVWRLLREIPAGSTVSYGEIAAKMGTPRDARDATAAIANNAIAILVPCHRVVKKDGSLSGYRWGPKRKRELLARERTGGNTLAIVASCHRVVRKDGSLSGARPCAASRRAASQGVVSSLFDLWDLRGAERGAS